MLLFFDFIFASFYGYIDPYNTSINNTEHVSVIKENPLYQLQNISQDTNMENESIQTNVDHYSNNIPFEERYVNYTLNNQANHPDSYNQYNSYNTVLNQQYCMHNFYIPENSFALYCQHNSDLLNCWNNLNNLFCLNYQQNTAYYTQYNSQDNNIESNIYNKHYGFRNRDNLNYHQEIIPKVPMDIEEKQTLQQISNTIDLTDDNISVDSEQIKEKKSKQRKYTKNIRKHKSNSENNEINRPKKKLKTNNKCKKVDILQHYMDYSFDEIKKLIDFSIKHFNLNKSIEDFINIQGILKNPTVDSKEKLKLFYIFIINSLCDYKEGKNPILKKSLVLLTYPFCELISFIYFFRNNFDHLLNKVDSRKKIISVVQEFICNFENMIKTYVHSLIKLLLNNCQNGIKDSQLILNTLKEMMFVSIKKIRYNCAELNYFLTNDTRIVHFYYHFVTTIYDINHGPHDTRSYEIILFNAFNIDELDTNIFFKETEYDEDNKLFSLFSSNYSNSVSSLVQNKYILEEFYNDNTKFYKNIQNDYDEYIEKMNITKPFEFIKIQGHTIYFKNISLPNLDKDEKFYVTRLNYILSLYQNIFSILMIYALDDN